MYTVEVFNGSLPPQEIQKRAKRVKEARETKRICKQQGCITPISGYNRDKRGHLETLCRLHRSEVGYPTEYARDEEDGRRRYECVNGHDIAEVGRKGNGVCAQCDRDQAFALYQEKVRAAGKTHIPLSSRVRLHSLARLMTERGVSQNALAKKTGIPAATLRGYAREEEEKAYKCPPDRAKMIAGYFGVSLEELIGEEG